MRHLVTVFAASVGVNLKFIAKKKKKSKCRVSTENSHHAFDIGDHPTAVKCLPIAAESFG